MALGGHDPDYSFVSVPPDKDIDGTADYCRDQNGMKQLQRE